MRRKTTEFESEIWEALDSGESGPSISKRLGVSTSTVYRSKYRKEEKDKNEEGKAKILKDFRSTSGVISSNSTTIKTVDDLLEHAEVDLSIWEVDRQVIGTWDVTLKIDNKSVKKTNYQIKIWLKRKSELDREKAFENVVSSLEKYKPKRYIQRKTKANGYMMELGLYDSHFGMLAWGAETLHGDYDLEIAQKIYVDAVKDILSRNSGYNISKIIFPVGHDFFHTNDPQNVTPQAKNKLDVDGRHIKVFETGVKAVIEAIELCRQIAPVEVLWVPGNHDPQTSYYLARIIDAHFNNEPNVAVDRSPNVYKAMKWGRCFIGFGHGQKIKHKDLPRVFIDDFPELWSSTDYREIHVGHFHYSKNLEFLSLNSVGQTVVRQFPSLCSIDAWHYVAGYRHNSVAMALYWDKEYGLTNIAQSFIK